MFNFEFRRPRGPAGAQGLRAYVVGDIHGRLDLLDDLLGKIHADTARRSRRKTLLVFVGDLIDRGPQSAQVVERLRTYRHSGIRPVFLLGNHEEVLLRIVGGDKSLVSSWLQFGGLECLASYGLASASVRSRRSEDLLEEMQQTIPRKHVEFLNGFIDSCRFGDYLFVHAGIRPGVELGQQRQTDLRWIRDPFLYDETDHGFVVVHGHTISHEVVERPNRIGIDTGAYRTGVLTALGIEDTERWCLRTNAPAEAEIAAAH